MTIFFYTSHSTIICYLVLVSLSSVADLWRCVCVCVRVTHGTRGRARPGGRGVVVVVHGGVAAGPGRGRGRGAAGAVLLAAPLRRAARLFA